MLKLTFRMKMHLRLGNARTGLAVVHLADEGSLPGTLLAREYERDLRASPRWVGRAERQMDPEPRLQALLDRFAELFESHPRPDWQCTSDALLDSIAYLDVIRPDVIRNDPSPKETTMHPDLQKLLRKDLIPLDAGGALVVASPYDRYHHLKIVGDHELAGVTQQGWRLVAIVQEQGYMMACEQVPNPNPTYGGTIGAQRAMPSLTTRYVVGRDEESALAEVHRTVEMKDKKLAEALQETRELRVKAEGADKVERENSRLAEWLAKAQKDLHEVQAALVRERDLQREKLRKYETDLGKVRSALGDLRMAEILGPKDERK